MYLFPAVIHFQSYFFPFQSFYVSQSQHFLLIFVLHLPDLSLNLLIASDSLQAFLFQKSQSISFQNQIVFWLLLLADLVLLPSLTTSHSFRFWYLLKYSPASTIVTADCYHAERRCKHLHTVNPCLKYVCAGAVHAVWKLACKKQPRRTAYCNTKLIYKLNF